MNILITGGTGFIGSHLSRALLAKGHTVILTKRTASDTWRIKDIQDKVKLYNTDTPEELETVFKSEKIECVVHLAMKYIKTHKSLSDVNELIQQNIAYPSQLLHLVDTYKIPSFINTGTFVEYETSGEKTSESTPVKPSTFYSTTKVAFENILKYFVTYKNIRSVTLKLFSPYGEMDNEKLIVAFIKSLLKNTPMKITKGEPKLSFTHIEDIVEAYVKAIEFCNSSQYKQYETFNIGVSEAWSVIDVIRTLEKIHGSNHTSLSTDLPYPPDEVMYTCCDNTKAQEVLGWKPRVLLEDGLKRTYEYYKNTL